MAGHDQQVKNGILKVAVVADTHGCFPEALRPVWNTADEIWHLGDFSDSACLHAFQRLDPPLSAVLGNNDFGLDLPQSLRLTRKGRTFVLIHILPRMPSGADVFLHGHTHVPSDETRMGVRLLNPGTIGKPNKGAPPSWAWLEIPEPPAPIRWRIVPLEPPCSKPGKHPLSLQA